MRIKSIFSFIIAIIAIFLDLSCKKDYTGPKGTGVTSLNIVNVIPGSAPLIPLIANANYQLPYSHGVVAVPSGSYQLYRFSGGNTVINFKQCTDTSNALLTTSSMNLKNYNVYSLFLTGNLSQPDTLLVMDESINLKGSKASVTDSSFGIRFVNLSPGSSPISVNLQGMSNGSEVSSLSYKSITDFKLYAASVNISSYQFEFRDVNTSNLLASYTLTGTNSPLNFVRFNNMNKTFVFYGLPGSQSVFLMNNY